MPQINPSLLQKIEQLKSRGSQAPPAPPTQVPAQQAQPGTSNLFNKIQGMRERRNIPASPTTPTPVQPTAAPALGSGDGSALGFGVKGVVEALVSPADLVHSALNWIMPLDSNFMRAANPLSGALGAYNEMTGSRAPSELVKSHVATVTGIDVPTGDRQAQGPIEHIAEGAGAAIGFIPAIVGGGAMASGASKLPRFARWLAKPFKKAPVRSTIIEAGAGGGAGFGFAVSEDSDSAIVKIAAPLIASMTVPLAAAKGQVIGKFARQAGDFAIAPFLPSASESRAAARLVRGAGDEPAVLMSNLAKNREGDIGKALSPAQATGDTQMMALESAIANTNPRTSARYDQGLADSTDLLTRLFQKSVKGGELDTSSIRSQLRNKADYHIGLLDDAVVRGTNACVRYTVKDPS